MAIPGTVARVAARRRGAPAWRLMVDRVTKRFGALTVLRDVSLSVAAGEIVALVGETGAGKSTLVHCIGRMSDADTGEILLDERRMPGNPKDARRAGVEIVWQEDGLCDGLDVFANLVLGREPRLLRAHAAWDGAALASLRRVGGHELPLDRAVGTLSRGQRQLVALARAFVFQPRLLILDEPTAPLSVVEAARLQRLIRETRDAGAGVLLVTHDLEQAFELADRIVVLRAGRIVADVSPLVVQRADVVALMSGIPTDSAARRQLDRLRSLADQLSDVDPAAWLPLIVSAMAAALEVEMLCVHLLENDAPGAPVLTRTAAVGLPAPLLDVTMRLPVGPGGGCAGRAAAGADVIVVDDLARQPVPASHRAAALLSGVRSQWAAPIAGVRGVLGTVSVFSTAPGHPEADRLELARVYLNHAASAIERDRLLSEVSRRNAVLETLSTMLETLAGPSGVDEDLRAPLDALREGLGADAVALVVEDDESSMLRIRASDSGAALGHDVQRRLQEAAGKVMNEIEAAPTLSVGPGLAVAPLQVSGAQGALVATWATDRSVGDDMLELLRDAAGSLALALEGLALRAARREAAALRRSQAIQRDLLSSLSHELRTPLTAIHGYASTLCQPDMTWDADMTERFLRSIATESARMERLVGDLLDATAIQSGVLRLQRDWCDLRLVVDAACGVVAGKTAVRVHVGDGLEPVWGDHDRLEQVIVNLLENAATHGASARGVDVVLRRGGEADTAELEVRDHGRGLPPDVGDAIFLRRVRGDGLVAGAGLGLAIARGIVEAHGGALMIAPVTEGTAFLVRLPTEVPPSAPGDAHAAWNVTELAEATDGA